MLPATRSRIENIGAKRVILALAALVCAVGIGFTALIASLVWSAEKERHQTAVDRIADTVAANVARETGLALSLQTAVAATLTTVPSLDAHRYGELVRGTGIFEALPSVRALAFAPLVAAPALDEFVKGVLEDATRRSAGYPPFRVWPEGERPRYAPATFVEPVTGNDRVFGFDLLSSAARRAAFDAAVRDWRPHASAPVVLTQDEETRTPGVLVVRPVGTPNAVIGAMAMGITIERLLKPLDLGAGSGIAIDDIGEAGAREAAKPVYREGAVAGAEAAIRTIDFGGRIWEIKVWPDSRPARSVAIIPLVLGVSLSFVGAFVVWQTMRARNDLEEVVARRTRDLEATKVALSAANADLVEQADRLSKANATKTEFLGRLGHELRTPLNAVIGFAEMMRLGIAGTLPPKQAEYVRDIHGAGSHLLDLVNRLLDLVKLESGSVTLDAATFDPQREISTVISMLKTAADAKSIDIRFEREPGAGPGDFLILGDALAFRQIVANLTENAIKFSPEGSAVTLGLSKRGSEIVLDVDDSGIGIPDDQLTLIFEPFHQVDLGDARRYGGAGLGLAIVRGLAERMGGSVSAISGPGQGAKFRLCLPASRRPLE